MRIAKRVLAPHFVPATQAGTMYRAVCHPGPMANSLLKNNAITSFPGFLFRFSSKPLDHKERLFLMKAPVGFRG